MRRIRGEETDAALALAWEVFSQFEAPVYGAKGTETFRRDIIDNAEFRASVKSGACPVWAAFDGEMPVCVIGMRQSRTHINLVFTKQEYQRRGLASALLTQVLSELKAENPTLRTVTLNSSPYGFPFYLAFGFVPTDTEQCVDGIRYTPMRWTYAENR
ncbi:MAG: GNAT family N-acetyltransferase [Clostridia bacterium]|nr:GNAT family N-acetyltransferase [Clostridia bacterium]